MRLVVLVLLILIPCLSGAQSVGRPSVFVDTDPMGARITVDGKLIAERTPALLRDLTPGKHTVSLWREGSYQISQAFVVADGDVPVVQVVLPPASVVLGFPANVSVVDVQGAHPTAGQQFRYPAGTYKLADGDGGLTLTPVFPDEGLLAVAGWGLALTAGSAVAATLSDVYHLTSGWYDHPGLLTVTLWASALLEAPWYLSLLARQSRFLRDSASTISPEPQDLDLAQTLFQRGEDALQSGDLAGASVWYARVTREHPDSWLVPGAWFRLARIHSVTGRRDLAIGEYLLVAESFPQVAYHDRARQALADLYEADGSPTRAIDNLDRMVLTDGLFDRDAVAAQRARLSAQEAPVAP